MDDEISKWLRDGMQTNGEKKARIRVLITDHSYFYCEPEWSVCSPGDWGDCVRNLQDIFASRNVDAGEVEIEWSDHVFGTKTPMQAFERMNAIDKRMREDTARMPEKPEPDKCKGANHGK